ncbi:MAG: DUF924 domain-containing protein [Symploca sp. SIO3C6]|uniref:DUF924 domain-containing protein n=1 Tax=Symploca sp. SIO1C4 TaxID=2607765 RepID=A0A6B3NGS8_9CYAN|nr:DUF924 domain-containing protein [Symploca sp. SIO3C6]NER30863.1 DUF924 domain-containing protein [Symploca sp. SIO1C4]NET08275.1 DUF924 domain-containing protein [Symploca sp. SIO2B6]
MSPVDEILDFWFGKPEDIDYGKERKFWFKKNPEFDQLVCSRFLKTYQRSISSQLEQWKATPQGCLALILLWDQFPRNMFRNQPQAFATDSMALGIAKHAVAHNFDKELLPVQRWFIYLPFEHSENLEDQHRCVELFLTLKDDPNSASPIDYAYRHLQVIERFGRFPHRNQILNRENTLEEVEFLRQPGSSF